ncbi:MAG: hypothetical protein C5B51_24360, partial [Terriglobia bacterium]
MELEDRPVQRSVRLCYNPPQHIPMTPARWQKVKQLCQSALEREPAQRAAFLAQACQSDAELER